MIKDIQEFGFEEDLMEEFLMSDDMDDDVDSYDTDEEEEEDDEDEDEEEEEEEEDEIEGSPFDPDELDDWEK